MIDKFSSGIKNWNRIMFGNVSIIGDGAMATVTAILLCEKNIRTKMWGYDAAQLKQMQAAGENIKFLPGYKFPEKLVFEPKDNRIMAGADLIVSAVPAQFMRGIWIRLKNYVPNDVPIVSVTKGIENDTLLRPTRYLPTFSAARQDTLRFQARQSQTSWRENCRLPAASQAMTKTWQKKCRRLLTHRGCGSTPTATLKALNWQAL